MEDISYACPRQKFMEDPGIQWREGKPDFTQVNKAYLEGRTRIHRDGSLEKIVEDLVKSWEMEASHKTNTSWKEKNCWSSCRSIINS